MNADMSNHTAPTCLVLFTNWDHFVFCRVWGEANVDTVDVGSFEAATTSRSTTSEVAAMHVHDAEHFIGRGSLFVVILIVIKYPTNRFCH